MFLSVQEFMTFTSQLIVERSAKGSRASVKEQGKRTAPSLVCTPSRLRQLMALCTLPACPSSLLFLLLAHDAEPTAAI